MDWASLIIGAIVGGIITVPIAIFGNIATPWVKSYFKKRSLSTRERKLYVLRSRYRYIKNLIEFPFIINYSMFRA